jgi:hypothetical protein
MGLDRTGKKGTEEENERKWTQWPLWRWANFLQRAWVWSCNGAYACGYLVPWCSPIGLRALVANQPFYADLELSQVNGTLCPRRSAYTPTLNSRLASLWRHISKSASLSSGRNGRFNQRLFHCLISPILVQWVATRPTAVLRGRKKGRHRCMAIQDGNNDEISLKSVSGR